MQERLQKVMSKAGIASRRDAEKIILAGRVAINGTVVTELGTKVDIERDKVTVDGRLIEGEKKVYIAFYKPKGVVTTLFDPEGRKTVADFVKEIPERIFPVGRLDYNTEGLLLMTNDGILANALMHPRHEIYKIYIAIVNGIPSEEELDLLRAGIKLHDGLTAPALVEIVSTDRITNTTKLRICIHEGRNRQVRRMFETIGHPVKQLKRIQIAFLTLEGLRRGQYRFLSEEEVEDLKRIALK